MLARRSPALVLSLVLLTSALAACATPIAGVGAGGSSGAGGSGSEIADLDLSRIPAPGTVVGQGTVLQIADAAPQFCLGAVALSLPPQCSGPELVGWNWDAVEGDESSAGVTWGSYAITGTWDGDRLTAQSSIMLALYDTMPIVDPQLDPANSGTTAQADLERIQQELTADPPFTLLGSRIENGYVFVDTLYDDGQIQEHMDYRYGPDVVAMRGALRDLG